MDFRLAEGYTLAPLHEVRILDNIEACHRLLAF